MKITILDKNTITTTNDINLSGFSEFEEFEELPNAVDEAEILSKTQNSDIIILNKVNLNKRIINQLSAEVKLIAITATGFDNVDVAAATARGIKVCNVPGYGTNSVAQLVLQFILNFANSYPQQTLAMQQNGWDKQTALSMPMHELSGKTLGIVGLGAIGLEVARLAHAFNMVVITYNRTQKYIPYIKQVELDELAANSDFISLNCALTSDTNKIINAKFLKKMQQNAYLINTARGGLIDEEALANAIKNKQIAGAGLDVLTNEPPQPDCPLLNLENVALTAHIGWATIEARQRCMDITLENIKNFILNIPKNLLN